MDCNRDEAIRAKEIAQKKMQNNDFEGAKNMAMKAKQLCSDLENITQLLAVCDVHCSAKIQILGTEKDWYGILQLDGKVDDATIKKQYRKLALVLHPDKNQFPGAEAAFKLIGEAHLVLSDSGKKAVYDSKIGALSKYAQAKNPPSQATNMQQRFWTRCPYCMILYQYYKNYLNSKVSCQNCQKDFILIEIGATSGSNSTRAVPQGVSVPPRSTYQTQAASQRLSSGFNNQSHVSNHGIPPKFHHQNQGAFEGIPTAANTSQPPVSHATYKAVEKNEGLKPLHSRSPPNLGGANSCGAGPNRVAAPNVHHMKPVEDHGSNKRKGKRKLEAEPSESFSSSSSSDSDDVISDAAAAQSDVLNEPRRSSRQKHNISYVEPKVDDADFESPLQRSRYGKSFCGSKVPREAADSLNNGTFGGKPSDELNDGDLGVESIDDSDSESCSEDNECSEPLQYTDPEFYDFNKDRDENCFRVNQFWACYDDVDVMPRWYAQIKKVCYNPLRLRISWLEFIEPNKFSRNWCKSNLPVACGNYRSGSSSTQKRKPFSHQIECDAGKRKDTFRIYPRTGEIWALFRDWNTGWVNNSPEKYAYDIVEVLSEFIDDNNIQVTSLEKVKGFKFLYHRNTGGKIFCIPPKEMLRFSHRIPSYKLKGGEKDGVPAGSFELDAASLISNQEADPKDPNDSKVPKT